jgi:hypothetical protein
MNQMVCRYHLLYILMIILLHLVRIHDLAGANTTVLEEKIHQLEDKDADIFLFCPGSISFDNISEISTKLELQKSYWPHFRQEND